MHGIARAARGMIASGVFGLLAFGFLFAALYTRETTASQEKWASGVIQPGIWDTFFRGHDLCVILQALLLVPAALAIRGRSNDRPAADLPPMAIIGAVANVLVAVALAMVFVLKSSDMLYMLPQGLVGLWIIWVAQTRPPGLGTPLRVLARVSGVGLIMVALACLGIAAAIGPEVLTLIGSVPTQVDAEGVRSTLNLRAHVLMDAGTVLGVLTLPIWSILAGRRMWRATAKGANG